MPEVEGGLVCVLHLGLAINTLSLFLAFLFMLHGTQIFILVQTTKSNTDSSVDERAS